MLVLPITLHGLLFQNNQLMKINTLELSHTLKLNSLNYIFCLEKNITNHRDINLISLFNNGIICFIINIYSNDQQNAFKYLKDIEINLSNILIITEDLNIKNNGWNPLYLHYSVYANTLIEIANSFKLKLS